jgi:4-azaleucine resistance transporter AzlC
MKRKALKTVFLDTLPVLTGYLFLGAGFGILLAEKTDKGFLWALLMSVCMFAGSGQYLAVSLIADGASAISAAVATFLINARHIFYGISMLQKYRTVGARKPYLIFALTDETYSLVCSDTLPVPKEQQHRYYLLVSLFNHLYWIIGSVLGAVVGSLISFNTRGIDFALTALFVTVFWDQWLSTKKHAPALIGVGAAVLCLVLFGSGRFLIPAMLLIALLLMLIKEDTAHA